MLLHGGSAALNLSLLASDFWAAGARALFFGAAWWAGVPAWSCAHAARVCCSTGCLAAPAGVSRAGGWSHLGSSSSWAPGCCVAVPAGRQLTAARARRRLRGALCGGLQLRICACGGWADCVQPERGGQAPWRWPVQGQQLCAPAGGDVRVPCLARHRPSETSAARAAPV